MTILFPLLGLLLFLLLLLRLLIESVYLPLCHKAPSVSMWLYASL